MSETGIRLTVATFLTIIWFWVLNGVTDWPTYLTFLAAVVASFFLSVFDLLFVMIIEALDD